MTQHDRAYILDRDGHIIRPVDLHCATEDEAREKARQLVDKHDVELWQLHRKIATFLNGP